MGVYEIVFASSIVDQLLLDEAMPVQREDDRRVGTGDRRERDADKRQIRRSDLVFDAFE